jgi:hypothetical protein
MTCREAPYQPPTVSSAGSPVNLFRSRVNGKASVIRAGCGHNSPAWWMRYDPGTLSWRTCQGSDGPGVPTLSLILPRWGTTHNGVSYLLRPSELLTSDGGSSWLPTPAATSYGTNLGGEAGRVGKEHPSLETMARRGLWPTPTAQDSSGSRRATARKDHWISNPGTTLTDALWTTPTARDAQTLRKQARGSGSLASGNQIIKPLGIQAWESEHGKEPLPQANGGQLNPTWVEWLMGFPPGWTDLEDSGTP